MKSIPARQIRIGCWLSVLLVGLIPGLLWGQQVLHAAPCTWFEPCLTTGEWRSQPKQVAQLIKRRRRPKPEPPQDTPAIVPKTFSTIEDRWRINDYKRNLLNPYKQNVLKGDYPIHGQHLFFVFTGISDTLAEFRELPIPAGVSSRRPDSAEFFGRNDQTFVRQNVLLRFELIEGNTAFKPPDWIFTLAPAFNINYVDVEEVGIVNPDVRDGTTRTRTNIALQEAFFEYHLTNQQFGQFFRGVAA